MSEEADDRFGGAWLVTEYVYNSDGSFAGTISQRRIVGQGEGDRLRVTQFCEPSPELVDHPMGAFTGEWVFELEVDGAHRNYFGPDVIGQGIEWQPGAMTGTGLWPRFGHEFTSYGVLATPERQLTGGSFFTAGQQIADIVGVAVPETAGIEPTLDQAPPAPDRDDWMIERAVGPMRIAISQLSPTHRRRLWAMHDAVSATNLRIIEDHHAGQPPTVTIET